MNDILRRAIVAAVGSAVACASEIPAELKDEADAGEAGRSVAGSGVIGGASTAAAGGRSGGSAGGSGGRAVAGSAGQATQAGAASGSGGVSAGAGGAGGSAGGAGQGGAMNPGATCNDAAAVELAPYSSASVPGDACLKLTVATSGSKKLTMQPDSATYPLPFVWSNCDATGMGSFTANYANQVITPVSSACPTYVTLRGSGTLHLQWWSD